jgi:protein tyrosine/serine phosphatase
MKRGPLLLIAALAVLPACASTPQVAIVCPARVGLGAGARCELPRKELQVAFDALRESGPERFSQVTDRLYRGGQPNKAQIAQLKALGVTTLVSLRREDPDMRKEEEAEAKRLGMKFYNFPFYGVFGESPAFFDRMMQTMRDPANGVVYVHCLHGRDRTSLAVALHLVFDQGWDAEKAWRQAATEYGHQSTFWYRELRGDFQKMVDRLKHNPTTAAPVMPAASALGAASL